MDRSCVQAINPMSCRGWLMVVMFGVVITEMSMLSNPATIISCGTRKPSRAQARRAAAAMMSDAQNMASGGAAVLSSAEMAETAVLKFPSGTVTMWRGFTAIPACSSVSQYP